MSQSNDIVTDALGNEIVIGNLYGYSRSAGGHSHTTVGEAKSAKNGKVRLIGCIVKSYTYGEPSRFNPEHQGEDVSMRGNMVFPVHNKNKEVPDDRDQEPSRPGAD